jgi:methionyl-tRNA formyltransferase
LDWGKEAIALHNQIRGFYPNCVTPFRDQPLKITATLPMSPDSQNATPGTIVELLKNQGAVVQTGNGTLLLKEVQMAGKRSQSGWDFVNGTRLQVGETLTTESLTTESLTTESPPD